MNLSFIILSLITSFLALLFYFPKFRYGSIILFLALVTLVPETNKIITTSVSSFYYYFLFPLLIFPKLLRNSKKKSNFFLILFLLVFIIFHSLNYYSCEYITNTRFFIKDLFAIFLVVFALLLSNTRINIEKGKLNGHIKIISVIAFFIILFFRFSPNLNIEKVNAIGFFIVLFIYYISSINNKQNNTFLLTLAILALILIGDRTILLIAFILAFKESFRYGLKGVLIVALPIILWQISPYLFFEDLSTLVDTNYVYNYLFTNRFTPFYEKMSEFNSVKDYIFGKGIGSYFYIPWFEGGQFGHYNVYSPTIDNLYFTLFAKYGIFSIIILILIFKSFKPYHNNKRLYINSLIFVATYCFTNSLIYQSLFIPLIFTFHLLQNAENSEQIQHN